jgi:hypothetical protein
MNELVTLKKIEQSKLAIREIKTLIEIKQIIDQGEALKAYVQSAKLSTELQAEVSELSARAKRRLGEISAKIQTRAGKRTDLVHVADEVTKEKTLSEIGVTKQYASEAEKLAKIPEKVFEEKIANAKATAEKITNSLFKGIGNESGKQKPFKKPTIIDWNFVYHSRLSYADEDPDVADLFEEMNNDPELKTDEAKIEYMRNNIEFYQGIIKAFKRAIAEMGY